MSAFVRAAPVTLLGGGAVSARDIDAALRIAQHLIAADGGADAALAAGHMPEAVIGDLDSISQEARARIPDVRVTHISEQDSTDFAKALTRIDAPFVIGLGFLGRRMDHSLAAMTVLVRSHARRCVLVGREDVIVPVPKNCAVDLPKGMRVSLFPMGPVRAKSTGLFWPLDGLDLTPAGQIGTSNRATGPVTIEAEGPLLLLLPRAALGALLRGLGWLPDGAMLPELPEA